jgi:hypothetical protein
MVLILSPESKRRDERFINAGIDFSRKDAKAQSAAALPGGFLCVFASLRDKYFETFGASRKYLAA